MLELKVLPCFKELDKRYKEYKAVNQSVHDWQSVHEDIRDKYK